MSAKRSGILKNWEQVKLLVAGTMNFAMAS